MKQGMILSVAGIGPARTSDAYHFLKNNLQGRLPEHQLIFAGNPFAGWQHPLKWAAEESALDATSRLLKCWTTLNEFVVKKVTPALDKGAIVVTQRFGLDALLYATACFDRTEENAAAEKMHHALVQLRIVQQGIAPPQYFIPTARPETITREWLSSSSSLRDVEPETLRAFIAHEDAQLKRYFDPRHGQKQPIWLEAGETDEQMCQAAIMFITREVGKKAVA